MIRGSVDPNFWEVARSLEKHVGRGGGAAVCVYDRGNKVVDIWAGSCDADGAPWNSDTLSMSFSTTKGVLATAIHILADRDVLHYDAPVADYWPEFAASGKGTITVRDVLTHRAGLPAIRPLLDCAERIFDWDYMTSALAAARPVIEPKRWSAYHALTFGWLAGEIIQRASGRKLDRFITDEIARPLGLDGLFIGAPKHVRQRCASLSRPRVIPGITQLLVSWGFASTLSNLYRRVRIPIDPKLLHEALIPHDPEILFDERALDCWIPAANGMFTARSLARMYAALASDGSIDGVRLLSTETLKRATEIQTRAPDRVLLIPMHWRLGYHSAFTTRGRIRTGFGHFGYGGSGAWADPERQLSLAMVTNRVGGGPFGDWRIAELGTTVMRCARRARRGGAIAHLEPVEEWQEAVATGTI
jgi:CubicO group peptidase (beta-lactamase class C family)